MSIGAALARRLCQVPCIAPGAALLERQPYARVAVSASPLPSQHTSQKGEQMGVSRLGSIGTIVLRHPTLFGLHLAVAVKEPIHEILPRIFGIIVV